MKLKRVARKEKEKRQRRQECLEAHQNDERLARIRLTKLEKDLAKLEQQRLAAKSIPTSACNKQPLEKDLCPLEHNENFGVIFSAIESDPLCEFLGDSCGGTGALPTWTEYDLPTPSWGTRRISYNDA